jgi:hypothetical protein
MSTRFLWSDFDGPTGPVVFQPEELMGLTVKSQDEWEEDEDWDEEDEEDEDWDEEDEEDEDWDDDDEEDDEDWEDDGDDDDWDA